MGNFISKSGKDHKSDAIKDHDHEITIIVNGREKTWSKKTISFKEVVELAFGNYSEHPNTCYTVTYSRGHGQKPEGSMVKDQEVKVKSKMIFNVTATDKS